MSSPMPITEAERLRRRRRILKIARTLGFVGRVEYRHAESPSGGASYTRGDGDSSDLLTVYARGFERNANPFDFPLQAMIAHERGHQLIARDPALMNIFRGITLQEEEVIASILGAIVVGNINDHDLLIAKASVDLLATGAKPHTVDSIVRNLEIKLRRLL